MNCTSHVRGRLTPPPLDLSFRSRYRSSLLSFPVAIMQQQQLSRRASQRGSGVARVATIRTLTTSRCAQRRPARTSVLPVLAASSDDAPNPVRAAIGGLVSAVYKVQGAMSPNDSGLSPLWQAVKRMDAASVSEVVSSGADLNERDASGDTALLYIARAGHYKYPPAEIPAKLIKAGADIEAKDQKGLTALQISLLAGWQNISELLIQNGASTAGVAAVKARLTCPDCKRVVAKYNL